jgi:hypothetical protein
MSFTYQSSSFISYITTDLLRGSCNVHLKNGACYHYSGVSRRAILNLQLNPCLSLGLWYNYNCLGGNTMREVPSTRKLWQSFA